MIQLMLYYNVHIFILLFRNFLRVVFYVRRCSVVCVKVVWANVREPIIFKIKYQNIYQIFDVYMYNNNLYINIRIFLFEIVLK